jgi:hypothetical protein
VDLRDALDPKRAIERRRVPGGPAPDLVRADIADARTQLRKDVQRHASSEGRLKAASDQLRKVAGTLAT